MNIYSFCCYFVPEIVWVIFNRKKYFELNFKFRHLVWIFIYNFYCYLAIFVVASCGTLWEIFYFNKAYLNINIIPFFSEIKVTYYLNILMFMPLGFLLPLIWKTYRKFIKVLIFGFGMSFSIEILQLINSRVTDIDDLLMNSLGTCIGYLLFYLIKRIFVNWGNNASELVDYEPVILLICGIMGVFLFYNFRWI